MLVLTRLPKVSIKHCGVHSYTCINLSSHPDHRVTSAHDPPPPQLTNEPAGPEKTSTTAVLLTDLNHSRSFPSADREGG